MTVADKYFDAWRQRSNNSLDGGMRYLLTDHASKLPPLSKVYNQDGVEDVLGPQDTLRLVHCPSSPLQKETSNLYGSYSGSIYDPWLTSVSCSDVFGERAVLILDRMPPKNKHSFVSLVQVEKAFERKKIEHNVFNVALNCRNHTRGGLGHCHDGYSCFFGKHHSYRSYVDDFQFRPTSDMDDKVSVNLCYNFMANNLS